MKTLPGIGAILTCGTAIFSLPAHAATNLDCMYEGYSSETLKIFDEFPIHYDPFDEDGWEDRDLIVGPIAPHAVDCAIDHEWSAKAIEQATYHQMAVFMTGVLKSKSVLTNEEMARLETEFAKTYGAKIRAIFAKWVQVGLLFGGEEIVEPSDEEAAYLSQVILAAAIPLEDAKLETASMLLAAHGVAKVTSENFADN